MRLSTAVFKCVLLIIIALFSLFSLLAAQSNVKIKTRIEIGQNRNSQINGLNKSGSLPANYYIVEETCSYLFEIMLAAKNSAPPEDEIKITFHDTTITIYPADYINHRDSWNEGGHDYCQQPPVNFTQTSYYSYSYDPVLAFMIPDLHQGDTLRFYYHNCTSEPAYGSFGDIEFVIRDVHGDACHAYYEGNLQDMLVCGLDPYRMKFFVWGYADTLTSGSSTTLSIYPYGDLQSIYPAVSDSLITIEVDSAQYAKFIYDRGTRIDTLDSPLDSVKCSDAMDGKIKFFALGKKPDKPTPVAFCVHLMSDPAKVFEDTIVVKGSEIMLGETKYYYAAQDINGKVTIHETSTPALPGDAIATDIWGDNPVTPVQIENEPWGRRLGVYWEKKYPVYTGNTFTRMEDLPTGIIRLVGRYWHKDSIYVVKLSTTTGSAGLGIQVVSPRLLGSSNFAEQRNRGMNIQGHPYSVDSICIKWGGIYGFPPQNIKGQYEAESFFDNALNAYTPPYRYEPWSAEFWSSVQNLRTTSHFWVTSQSMGNGDGVPDHENTRYMAYAESPQRVWDLIVEYSTIVYNTPPNEHGFSLFGHFNQNNGRLTFIYPRATNQYNLIHNRVYRELGLNNNIENYQANLRVRNDFIEFISNSYYGGLGNRIAQSRIASSYGPLQTMYTVALEEGYQDGVDDTPEDLNDLNIFFPFAMEHHVTLLEEQIGEINANNWEEGFEATMINIYHGWNDKPGYNTSVLKNARKYLPTQ